MFTRAKPFLDEVPYDPELKDVFVGEEILHSARIWTAGYDIYSPTENIAFHKFTRADEPKFWTDLPRDDSAAMKRVRYLLELSPHRPSGAFTDRGLDRYGMGTARDLKSYYEFASIDPETMSITRNFCNQELLAQRIGLPQIWRHGRLIKIVGICVTVFILLLVILGSKLLE